MICSRIEEKRRAMSTQNAKNTRAKPLDCKICVHGLTRLTRQFIIVLVEFRHFAAVAKFLGVDNRSFSVSFLFCSANFSDIIAIDSRGFARV